MVRKGGLEPPWAAPLEPKSSASTNSATFAAAFAETGHYSGFRAGTPGKRPAADVPFPMKCSAFRRNAPDFACLSLITKTFLSRRCSCPKACARPSARSTASRATPTTLRTKAISPLRRVWLRSTATSTRSTRSKRATPPPSRPSRSSPPRSRATACRWRRCATSCPRSGRTS